VAWLRRRETVYTHLIRFHADDTMPVESRDGVELLRAAEQVAGWDTTRSVELIETVTDQTPTVVLTRLRRTVDAVRQERHADARSASTTTTCRTLTHR
jgi:hypothetical protein